MFCVTAALCTVGAADTGGFEFHKLRAVSGDDAPVYYDSRRRNVFCKDGDLRQPHPSHPIFAGCSGFESCSMHCADQRALSIVDYSKKYCDRDAPIGTANRGVVCCCHDI